MSSFRVGLNIPSYVHMIPTPLKFEKNCLLLMFFLGQLEGYKILGFNSI